MSNILERTDADCQAEEKPCDGIDLIIRPKEKSLGEFSVRRVLPFARRRMVGPWVFFDHAGPVTFEAGQAMDVRPHPHIGLATVSYLYDGAVMHKDSLGYEQRIVPGEINLMTAGRGIVHSERSPVDLRGAPQNLHLLQLWLALPDELAEIDPAFDHYGAERIPEAALDGVRAKVLMGAAHGLTSPVKTYSETLYVDYELAEGASLTLPETQERAIYVVSGALLSGDTLIDEKSMAVFESGAPVELIAKGPTKCALIGGAPLGARHIWWNFVSSSKERIEQAKSDWRDGKFDKVSGEDEFIPLPA